ncbi:NADH-quinone oxidoreductase subunit J [Candidatus Formimonas warabiya]|uniref:NADH-quinone oxidoreductase subunit J n=1 Tax=Formimonas warabiya TaxID=1761012 RepID=A0A3G1L0M5_FORW1|nr:NADH-quinone oxidoreductase subunit J [Candidatus Formimonas warabiya]ATW28035.1 NADH-quinone oxidoreductase subunit J [Candidatus Formimonas warabiya]
MDTSIIAVLGFLALAALAVFSALAVVLSKNIVHSTLFLAASFIGVAGLYMLLNADFLAAVQIIVYAGAVPIMIVFGVMLIHRGSMKQSNLFNSKPVISVLVALATFALITLMIFKTNWQTTAQAVPEKTAEHIAELLLGKYVIPFEVVALLLLVALIGAIVIAKEVKSHDRP